VVIEDLQISIERLYETFSYYPSRPKIEGCPCCISTADKEKIHTKQLRQLNGEDLSKFAFKAMTTWGDLDDFKHYLPRIFELISTTDFIVDSFVVLGKLEYGQWTNWKVEEQEAIKEFLLAWWKDITKHKSNFDKETFIEIYKLFRDIRPILDNWTISNDDQSFTNLIDFIDSYYYELISNQNNFKVLDKDATKTLLNWIKDKQEILTSGFFYYEQIDNDFAEKISNALFKIEQST